MALSFIKRLKEKAEKIRTTIEEGTTTLRELRSEVEGTVNQLKADSEEKLMDTVTEIQESVDVFEEAGYELVGLRLEMGFNPKVVPKIKRVLEISDRNFEKLIKEYEDREVVSALLRSIRKVEQLEDKVKIPNLEYDTVEIEVGVVPAVHITWTEPVAMEPAPPLEAVAVAVVEEKEEEEESSLKFTSSYEGESSTSSHHEEEAAEPIVAQPAAVAVEEEKEKSAPVVPGPHTSTTGLGKWMKFPKVN